MDRETKYLVKTEEVKKYYRSKSLWGAKEQIVRAVDGISIQIPEGSTYGLVGESGCGKSTFGATLLQMQKATSGNIWYRDKNLMECTKQELTQYKKKMQMIYQDPYASLNPFMNVEELVCEPLTEIMKLGKKESSEQVRELLNAVGLHAEDAHKYAHEFSGGQRQRIGIARALAVHPEFVVCDEPVSALDVSVQAQVIQMLLEVQEQFGLTYLFIAHDLTVVHYVSDRIGVMYLGKIVESAESDELCNHPLHPYTQGLLEAVPVPDPKEGKKKLMHVMSGEIPSALDTVSGCAFASRCPYAQKKCKEEVPELRDVGKGHQVACHLR